MFSALHVFKEENESSLTKHGFSTRQEALEYTRCPDGLIPPRNCEKEFIIAEMEGITASELLTNAKKLANDLEEQKRIIKEMDDKGFYANFYGGFLSIGPKEIHISGS